MAQTNTSDARTYPAVHIYHSSGLAHQYGQKTDFVEYKAQLSHAKSQHKD